MKTWEEIKEAKAKADAVYMALCKEFENEAMQNSFKNVDDLQNNPLSVYLTPPADYELYWGRYKTNESDPYEDLPNIAKLQAKRYLPVAPCLYPELPSKNGRIEYKGSVLLMRQIHNAHELCREITESHQQKKVLKRQLFGLKKLAKAVNCIQTFTMEKEEDE